MRAFQKKKKKKYWQGGPNFLSTASKRADVCVCAWARVQPFPCCGVCAGLGTGALLNSCICQAGVLHQGLFSYSLVNNLYLKIQEPGMSSCLNSLLKKWSLWTLRDMKPPGCCNLERLQRWRFHCKKTYPAHFCTETLGDSLYLYLLGLCRQVFFLWLLIQCQSDSYF